MEILAVIDMQNDFINGSLGTKEAQAVLPKVVEKIKSFPGRVLFTKDTHDENYLHTQEGKLLPIPHCIKGTAGWELHPDIEAVRRETPIEKNTFGSTGLAQVLKAQHLDKGGPIEKITLVGLCTDVCVISNALLLKAFLPETVIEVDASCCAGVTPKAHECALEAMKACQIQIVHS